MRLPGSNPGPIIIKLWFINRKDLEITMKDLYCPNCKEIRITSRGKGATIEINGQSNNLDMIKKHMKCNKCGSSLVTKEELNPK